MKGTKKIILLIILGCCIAFIIFNISWITLIKSEYRGVVKPALSNEVTLRIESESIGLNEKEIVDYSLSLTSELLAFDDKNNIKDGRANCVGYAQLCSYICNYAFNINRMACTAKPVVGDVKILGLSICKVASSLAPTNKMKLFLKDHDFIEVNLTSSVVLVDPSLYDLIGCKCTTYL